MGDCHIKRWQESWDAGRITFHRPVMHPKLNKHKDVFLGTTPKTVFFPLCGKTVDMVQLYREGHSIIGCEAVDLACRTFFKENEIEMDETSIEGAKGTVFESKDKRIRLFCCDIFDLTKEVVKQDIDCIFDRGSLVALRPDLRERYASTLKGLFSKSFSYLLLTLEFDGEMGPPFSVSLQIVKNLFGDSCTVRTLESKTPTTEPIDFSGPDIIYDNIFLLTPLSEENRVDYWQTRWVEGTSMWHSNEPHNYLVKHFDKLKGDSDRIEVFLPMCGKAGCLMWLYNAGHSVIGLEGVVHVAEEVFTGNKLEYTKTVVPEIEGIKFQSKDGRMTIYSCDIFKMKPEVIGKVKCVYDRGAFEAIEHKDREKYAAFMSSILAPGFRYLLNGYEYDDSDFKGPPRNVPREVVFKLFGTFGSVSILVDENQFEATKPRFGVGMTKVIYYITSTEEA